MATKKTIRLTPEEQAQLDKLYGQLEKNTARGGVFPAMGITIELSPKNKKLSSAGEQEGLWKVITTQSWHKLVLPECYQAALDKKSDTLKTPSEEKATMAIKKKTGKKAAAKKKPAAKKKAAAKKAKGEPTSPMVEQATVKAKGGRKVQFPNDLKYKVTVTVPKGDDALKALIGCRPGTNRAKIRTGMLKKGLRTVAKLRAYLVEELEQGFHNSDFAFHIDAGNIELSK